MHNEVMQMTHSDELEKAFSDYLDEDVYERNQEFLFRIVRDAFAAGWYAAKKDSLCLTAFKAGRT